MTDLHTHILPGMDDGAKDTVEAAGMLAMCYSDGVKNLVFSSHFSCERETPENFLERRAKSYESIKQSIDEVLPDLDIRLGAEVFFSPRIMESVTEKLCIEGTPYMLIELPTTHYPLGLKETLFALQRGGITPIIAHVERYPYLFDDLGLICDFVESGVLFQANCGSIIAPGKTRRRLLKMIEQELVCVIASDTHNASKRKPNLKDGLMYVKKTLGEDVAMRLEENAKRIFIGGEIG